MLVAPSLRHPTLYLRAPLTPARPIAIKLRDCLFPQLAPRLLFSLRRRARPIEHNVAKALELAPVAEIFQLIASEIHRQKILAPPQLW
jgi:hypothetical protein